MQTWLRGTFESTDKLSDSKSHPEGVRVEACVLVVESVIHVVESVLLKYG